VRVALGVVLLALAGGAGGLALAADGGGHPGTRTVKTQTLRTTCPPPRPPQPTVDPTGQPDPGVLAAFGVLRRPATPADAVPASLLRHLPPFVDGVLSGAARLVRVDAPGTRVWIVPVRVANRMVLPPRGCAQSRAAQRPHHPQRRRLRSPFTPDALPARAVPSRPVPPRLRPSLPVPPPRAPSHFDRVPRTPQPGIVFVSDGDDGPSQSFSLDQVRGGIGISGNLCAGPSRDMLAFSGPVIDGVTSVTVVNRDGSSVQADVTNNVYVLMLAKPATADAGPDRLQWTDPTGVQRSFRIFSGRGATVHCAPLPDFSVGRRVGPSRAPIELSLPTPPGTPGMPALVTLVRHVGPNTTCAVTGTPDGERGVHENVTSSISCFSAPTIRNRRFMLRAARMTGDRTLLTGMVDRRIVRWLTVERGPSPEQGAFRMNPSRSGVVTVVFHGSHLHGASWTVTAALRERGRILVSKPVELRLSPGHPPPESAKRAKAINPKLLAQYAVFRRPRNAADVFPHRSLFGGLRIDANPAFSRRVATSGEVRVYVVPGDHDVCLIEVSPRGSSGGCGSVEGSADGRRPMGSFGSSGHGAHRYVALLADGTSDVVGTFAGGVTRTLTPHDNVLVLVTHRGHGLRSVRFTAPDGSRHRLF
jgi:hypothetical protein